jgi:hypothetical protein
VFRYRKLDSGVKLEGTSLSRVNSFQTYFRLVNGGILLPDLKTLSRGRGLKQRKAMWCSSTMSAAAQTVISCIGEYTCHYFLNREEYTAIDHIYSVHWKIHAATSIRLVNVYDDMLGSMNNTD